jgi:CheY-like chemotaxis protein
MNEPSSGSPRVLVVDDDDAIREFLRDLLGSEGYEVDEAANGAEAVERVRANPPSAVLMDLMMPVLSGAEATARLKNDPATARIPILAMSAGRNLAALATGIPADGFVSKPFDLTLLVSTLAAHTRSA